MTARCLAVLAAVALLALALAPAAQGGPDVVKRELIRESARISDIGQAAAREALARAFAEPVTEADVVEALSRAMVDAGSSPYVEGFQAIVASGPASAIPHGDPSDDAKNAILPGEVVVVDIGARYKGWVSDNTKTYFLGVEPPEEFVKIYMIVQEAQKRAYESIRSLERAADLDAAARGYIADQGYGENFLHCLGHGVGLYVHVLPRICPDSDDVLLSSRNDVVAIEPGIYLEGCFGVRIEDDFAVLRAGYERYTFAPSDLAEIMLAPPQDWNGSSPTGEFADYSGCPFFVDAKAAAGAAPRPPSAAPGGGAEVPLAAAGVLAAGAAVLLHRAGKLQAPPAGLDPRPRFARASHALRGALRRGRS